jgi:hypothetical protein
MRNGLGFAVMVLIAFACFFLPAKASEIVVPQPTVTPTAQPVVYSKCTYLPSLYEGAP